MPTVIGRNCLLLFGAAVLLCLPACGSSDAVLDKAPDADPVTRQPAAESSELDQRWLDILADPGKPGVDYSTRRLTVSYRPGSSLTRGLLKLPAAGQRAADQGNALLRKDKSYEALTDAIAGQYGLRITNQVYMGRTAAAGFELPKDADGQAVIDSIRRDFGDVIEWVTFARLAQPCYDPNDPGWAASSDSAGPVWGVRRIGCQSAWNFTLGEPDIIVAVMDSGCNIQHEELVNTVIDPAVTFPLVNCDVVNQDNSMEDLQSHGSGCVGMVACQADNNLTLVGAAPNCKVLALKITNDWNDGSDMNVVEAGYLAQALGVRALSMSFGYGGPVPIIGDMCADLDQGGMLLIASAGNEDSEFELWPAAFPMVMSVGATNGADERISHPGFWGSNFGPGVDIAAPGEDYLSCSIGATDAYQGFGGTSGAAPLVLAAAALAYSYFPTWSNDDVQLALESTGDPTTGFGFAVPRVDAGNLFSEFGISMILRPPKRLLEHGTFELTPEVNGRFDSIEALLNDVSVQTLVGVPWTFDLDLNSLGFEDFNVKLNGFSDPDAYFAERSYWVDNSVPAFPFKDGLDDEAIRLRSIDPRQHDVSLLSQLYLTTPTLLQNLLENGPGDWRLSTDDPHAGSGCFYCGLPSGDDYGAFELDCLVSQAVDLSPTANPTLSYYQRYNIEDGGSDFDKANVFISDDYGLSWELGQLKDGAGLASFSGASDWSRVDIDLSSFAGQTVHIAFVFNSDELATGENALAPKGWWIDEINISKNYKDQLGLFGSVNSSANVLGLVPGALQLDASIVGPDDVGKIIYTLDILPFNNDGPEDEIVESSLAPFSAQLFLSGTGFDNQIAQLRAHSFDSEGADGMQRTTPVYIFNHLGDTNADGIVDQADRDLFDGKIGLTSGQPGYVPFLDSDQDGQISEADAAAVGFFWTPEG